ncbi:hypothetical protein [Nocardiopsis sp. CA-288880]|uniref:hypothetical protein n=1 Tax=Nocardiopsis sp. CA-288880 TaxID=3239995 RepID=UPI003D97CF34
MAGVQPGQTYINNKSGGTVRVVRIGRSYYLGPSAWIEGLDGKRGRWKTLAALHTDGKPRKSGYSLKAALTSEES